MNCVCGHPEKDHVLGGHCRVPDCPCEHFRPGDTLRPVGLPRPSWAGATTPGALALLIGLLLIALPGVVGAADPPAPPPSFARVAKAARAAAIVLRASDVEDSLASHPVDDEWPDAAPLDDESGLSETLAMREQRTLAAGIIVDPRGFALTSARAVLLTPVFEVFLVDGTPVKATVLAVDRRSDVAVLQLDNGGVAMPYLPLGDSDRVAAGEWVIAVSAPMGLEGTVTAGVITAVPTAASLSPLGGYLQTDASIGVGNAGAPVVSLGGAVVGLSTLLSGDGITYVRPATTVRSVYLELLERGRVSRPWLGLATQALSIELARALGARDEAGVLVADVHPESPGASAGLRSGDIVVALDGTPLATRAQLERAVGARRPGRVVTLSVRRAARELAIPVRLGEEPDAWRVPPALARAQRLLGIQARAITPTMGVVAGGIDHAGPAARAGIAAGDVIREVNRQPIRTMGDFQAAVRAIDPKAPVLMLIQRGEFAVYVALALSGREGRP